MPLQLLHGWWIFPAAMGLFAIQSPRLPQVASAREDPTRPALCRLSGQTLSARWGQLAHSTVEPAKTSNQTINSYSPKRITEIVSEPITRAKGKELGLACNNYLPEQITEIVSEPVARAKGKELGLACNSCSPERITEIVSEPVARAKGKELGLAWSRPQSLPFRHSEKGCLRTGRRVPPLLRCGEKGARHILLFTHG
jgi:hypothetical protein